MSTELLLVCETSKSLGTNENPNTKKISLKHFMFLADTYVFGLTLVELRAGGEGGESDSSEWEVIVYNGS